MERTVTQLPITIDPCPIEEAILEIRYSSKVPNEAIFGMLYANINKFFDGEPISLPTLQVPEQIRRQDPSFKYKPYHQLRHKGQILNIGPDVLTFSKHKPYVGWQSWSDFFYEVLDTVFNTGVVAKVERLGLRYINVFNDNIFDKINCDITINTQKLTDESTNLRTEMNDGGYSKNLQIGNNITLVKDNKPFNCSVIDIDVLYNIKDSQMFFNDYHEVVEEAHLKEKELFFSLLNPSFLEKFNPNYGE